MDINTLFEQTKEILMRPNMMTYVAAAAGTLAAGYASIRYELKQSRRIPLAYSEIEDLKISLDKQEGSAKEFTMFLAGVNDLCMQIFESYNDSYEKTTKYTGLSDALRDRISNTNHGSTISDLVSVSADFSDQLRGKLKDQIVIREKLDEIIKDFDETWNETHEDVYNPVVRTTVSVVNGKTQVSTHIEQVYDHTDHEYTYDKEAGTRADNRLSEMINSVQKLKSLGTYDPIKNPGKEGKDSAQKSRSVTQLPDEELSRLPSMWRDGTQHDDNMEGIIGEYEDIKTNSKLWHKAKDTAKKHYSYQTNSSSDPGPEEYQVAQAIFDTATDISGKIGSLVDDINMVSKVVPHLYSDINNYLSIADYVKYNPNDKANVKEKKILQKKILKDTKELYSGLFDEGIDTDGFKEWKVILLSGVGAVLGAGAGHLIEYFNHIQ